ncbi:unnamed protein product [Ectocarpus sp. CCAP 1310/34]|nr:unnamed protein product [Ectocarpus sp. CCAP 1310/34]
MAAAARKKQSGHNNSSIVVAVGTTDTPTSRDDDTKSQFATPPRVPAQAAERAGGGWQEPIAGIFPCAGPRPLPAVVLQSLFGWLLSSDLSALHASSVAASSPETAAVLETTVASLVKHRYGRANPTLREEDTGWRRDLETLRHAELSHVASLVRGPQRPGKGYYLSKSWAGNLRRYVEAQARRRRSPSFASNSAAGSGATVGGSGGKEKRSRGRERAESNLMPPWQDVNADIMCQHGGLARSSQGNRAKRQVVDKRVWRELVLFFPAAVPFRAESVECLECRGLCANERKAEEAVKSQREQEIALPVLRALYGRKTGVPSAALSAPRGSPGYSAGPPSAARPACPLLPGIYHLLPRYWLNAWRAYVRDPRAPSPRTLDTALLLCEGHGLLLAPPHVEEFLSGERRALLGGLDPDRSGCVCEVVTPEEWDALTLLHPCDLGVRFCIDPDSGAAIFNSKKCKSCDPCYIGDLYVRPLSRKLSV